MLNSRQIREIVAFDRAARMRQEYDSRRCGTMSKRSLAYQSANVAAADPFGGIPEDDSKRTTASVRQQETAERLPRKTLRYNYIVPVPFRGKNAAERNRREREVTVYHVAVRLNKAYRPVVKDVAHYSPVTNRTEVRDMGYHGLGGWIVYWDRKDYENKSIRAWICPHGLGGWFKHDCKWSDGLKFPWHETVNVGALKGTRYEWCQYADGRRTGLCDWLWLYRQEPHVETLAKLGICGFVTPYAMKTLKDRKVLEWVKSHLDELRKGFSVKEAVWAAKHGQTLRYARKRFALVEEITRRSCGLRGTKFRLDYDLLMKLLPKWHARPEEYVRYLEEAKRAGQDLANWGTLYPPTKGGQEAFLARTEAFEREGDSRERREVRLAKQKRRREEKKRLERLKAAMAVRGPEIERFQKSLDRTKTLSGCGYRLVLAKTQEELRKEGRRMDNCVGCGTYGEGIVMGDLLILTIQGKTEKERYCVEITRKTWTVRQCYGRHNTLAPDEIHQLATKVADELMNVFRRSKQKRRTA